MNVSNTKNLPEGYPEAYYNTSNWHKEAQSLKWWIENTKGRSFYIDNNISDSLDKLVNKKPTEDEFKDAVKYLYEMANTIQEKVLGDKYKDTEFGGENGAIYLQADLAKTILDGYIHKDEHTQFIASLGDEYADNHCISTVASIFRGAEATDLLKKSDLTKIKKALETYHDYFVDINKQNKKADTDKSETKNFISRFSVNIDFTQIKIDLGQQYLEQLLENENRLESNKNATNNSDKIVQEVLKKDSKQTKSAVSSERSEVAIESKKDSAKNIADKSAKKGA